MKIGVSMRGLGKGSYAISAIILQLTNTLIDQASEKHEFFLYFDNPDYEKYFPDFVQKRSCNYLNIFLWDHIWLPWAIKNDQLDMSLFMKGTIPFSLSCRAAVIFHDLGYFDRKLKPYTWYDTLYQTFMMPRSAREASIVFADSKSTRDDLLFYTSIEANKIIICHQDCDPIYQPITDEAKLEPVRRKYNLPKNYIFCPTSISPRKNLKRILEAFELIKQHDKIDLVITGGQVTKERALMRKFYSGIFDRVHILGAVPLEDMPSIYSMADFTLYPSLLEGFGLPILEAFRCGCPVITSNITSMPEVAGDAALYVNPYDTQQIADRILRLIVDKGLQKELKLKGFEQAKNFSWKKTASVILKAFEGYV